MGCGSHRRIADERLSSECPQKASLAVQPNVVLYSSARHEVDDIIMSHRMLKTACDDLCQFPDAWFTPVVSRCQTRPHRASFSPGSRA